MRGRPDAGVAWALYKLRMARGGATQLQGDLLQEDASQPGGQDGAVAVSLVLSRPVPRSQSELSAGWRRGEWVQVRNSCRVKTIRIAAYSVMYIPTYLLLHLE